MAVPKKRTSKSKKNSRRSHWKREAFIHANKALSLAKSAATGNSKSFVHLAQFTEEGNNQ
nr:ribosomal protein L32 [Boldiaceae sp.]